MVRIIKYSLLISAGLSVQSCKQSEDSKTNLGSDDLSHSKTDTAPQEEIRAGLTRFAPRECEFLFSGRGFTEVGESLLNELDEEANDWNNGFLIVQETEESDLPEVSPEQLKSTTDELARNPLASALGNEFLICGWNGTDKVANHLSGIWDALGRLRIISMATGYAGILKGGEFAKKELEPILDEALASLTWDHKNPLPSLLFAMEPDSPSDGVEIKRDFLKALGEALEANDFSHQKISQTIQGSVFEGYSSGIPLPGDGSNTLPFVILAGQLEEGLLFYFGDKVESLSLPKNQEQSIHPTTSSLLWNAYAGKEVIGLSFTSRELAQSLYSFSASSHPWSLASSVFEKAGLLFENQREIDQKLSSLENLELTTPNPVFHDQASVIFLEEGINLEEIGGAYFPEDSSQDKWNIHDRSSPSTFHLHYRVNEGERSRNLLQLEESLSLLYLLFKEITDPLGVDEQIPSVSKFSKSRDINERLGMIYQSWKDQVLTGIGSEYLIVGDLNGSPPDGATHPLPRAVMVAPTRNWQSLALGLSRISRHTRELHRSVSSVFEMNEDWPLTDRINQGDWHHYRERTPGDTNGWQPAIGWNRKFFFIGSNENFAHDVIQDLSIRDEGEGHGFLLDVDLGEILDLIWEWDQSARPIERESFRISELNFLRERISRLNYRARNQGGRHRVSLQLGFRENN